MIYEQAKKLADRIVEILTPYCEIINIAGSIRREKSDCGDIEVVCLPLKIKMQNGLFDEGKLFRTREFKQAAASFIDEVIKGDFDGKMMQVKLKNVDMKLDLFMPDDFDYYRQYAIRTGSADYSHKVIAQGWIKKGWCGSDKGLRLQSDCEKKETPDGKGKWICYKEDAQLPPIWKSEEEFFDWIGVKYLQPKFRNI